MGNEQQFKDMVTACRSAGVKVYVDAVINHITGQGSTSYGAPATPPTTTRRCPTLRTTSTSTPASARPATRHPGLQQQAAGFKCNLVGLEDLRTEQYSVQNKLAAYLNKLIGYGVSGFRVDAAKQPRPRHPGHGRLAQLCRERCTAQLLHR